MKFTVSYPPSSNRYWRNFRGITVLSKEAKEYRQTAAWEAKAHGVKPLDGPLTVKMTQFRPKRVGDIDNRIKVICDALNGVAWVDDKQIDEMHVYRFEDKKNPRLEIEVYPSVPKA